MLPKTALDPTDTAPHQPTQSQQHARVELFAGHRARVALAIGPLLSVIVLYAGGAIHPKEYKNAAATLRSVAAHPGLWAASHILMVVGALSFVLTVPGFLLLARGRGARAVRLGAASAAVGMLAMAIDPIEHGILAPLLVNSHIPAGMAGQVATDYQHHWLLSALMPVSVLLPLGFLLIGAGQVRGGHRLAGWSLVVGTMIAFAAPASQLMFLAAGLPLMLALGMAARRALQAA